jgi:hypothetical protein
VVRGQRGFRGWSWKGCRGAPARGGPRCDCGQRVAGGGGTRWTGARWSASAWREEKQRQGMTEGRG